MVISRLTCGKGKQAHERYFLMEGDSYIAWFDDLETAAKVIRFIKGAHLEKADYAAAKAALEAWDKEHGPQKEVNADDNSEKAGSNTGPVDMQD